jgi:hypothetical protein
MKGTIQEIVGQESGFMIYNNKKACILENWAPEYSPELNSVYDVNTKETVVIKNCLAWLIESGWITFNRNHVKINYQENAMPVFMEELLCEGILYDFGEFKVLAPKEWF